jgi:hypothetical protein
MYDVYFYVSLSRSPAHAFTAAAYLGTESDTCDNVRAK